MVSWLAISSSSGMMCSFVPRISWCPDFSVLVRGAVFVSWLIKSSKLLLCPCVFSACMVSWLFLLRYSVR